MKVQITKNDVLIGWDEASNMYMVQSNGSDGFVLKSFKEMKKEYNANSHTLKKVRKS